MSGGHFDYIQYRVDDVVDEIRRLIDTNESEKLDDFGHVSELPYSEETISKFKEAEVLVRKAAKMIHLIDWLISGDDGEETFHERWKEEV